MEKIKVGAVSYLNTKPLLYGIERSALMADMELIVDYPSSIAQQLIDGKIDVGLVPVAVIPRLQEYHIITDYCIGAVGDVASVCLFADEPLQQVKTVLLDYQSRTSVALCKVLLEGYWKLHPTLEAAQPDFREQIKDDTAGVVIGDRAFEQRKQSRYMYDLAGAWIDWTGLPFVFAAWIANKPLPLAFINAFNAANGEGFQHLDEIIAAWPSPHYDLRTYYTQNISYQLDDAKKQGLQRFISELVNSQ
jgi:chorismate dehydratase